MKTAAEHNANEGSTTNVHTFVSSPVPKTCRHRNRNSLGRCHDCGMREPVLAENASPSVPLLVKI